MFSVTQLVPKIHNTLPAGGDVILEEELMPGLDTLELLRLELLRLELLLTPSLGQKSTGVPCCKQSPMFSVTQLGPKRHNTVPDGGGSDELLLDG
jgi:hypothetical protein